MSESPKWYVFALVGVFAALLFAMIVKAALVDADLRDKCRAKGGQVITGLGYMGRSWECRVKARNTEYASPYSFVP